jgi:hypothetical protein
MIIILAVIAALIYRDHENPIGAASAADMASTTVQMTEDNDSGLNGVAVITGIGKDASRVAIEMTGEPDGADETVSIYTGSCALIGGNAYLLNDLVDGMSTTTIDVSLSELLGQQLPLAINIQDAPESATSTACGDIGASQ